MSGEVAEVAERIIKRSGGGYVIREPATPRLDPLAFLLILPFLPLYILALAFTSMNSRRIRVTRIERTQSGGYEILEVEY